MKKLLEQFVDRILISDSGRKLKIYADEIIQEIVIITDLGLSQEFMLNNLFTPFIYSTSKSDKDS